MPLEFDAKSLTVNQLILFEEYSEKMSTGTVSMKDVRTLIASLLKQTPEWVGENVTYAEMETIMGGLGRITRQVSDDAVPLATSASSSPTPTGTVTRLPAGS